MSNKDSGQTARDEHNDAALAKRTLQIGFDYIDGKYVVIGTDSTGRTILEDSKMLNLLECLLEGTKETNKLLRKILN